jgi:hypothetical protein
MTPGTLPFCGFPATSGGVIIERVTVLLSRQPLRPCGHTGWVRQSVAAVRWIKQQGHRLLSSVGLQTWELATGLASIEHIPLELYVPVSGESYFAPLCEALTHQFALMPGLVSFVPVSSDVSERERRLLLSRRDRFIVQLADCVVPISVRPNGNMAELLAWAEQSGKRIVRDFEIAPEKHTEAMKYTLENEAINPALTQCTDACVIHWTRATNAAWPGERLIDLYTDVISSPCWPRNAFSTLKRILDSGTLLASSRHMPGNIPCVCFSALPPAEVIPLMRWRARYAEMSFEPYGIGVRRDVAESLGILPVHYYGSSEEVEPGGVEPWRCQSVGEITDWRTEKEHRCQGDFQLDTIPRDAITLYCRTAAEGQELQEIYGYDVIPFLA